MQHPCRKLVGVCLLNRSGFHPFNPYLCQQWCFLHIHCCQVTPPFFKHHTSVAPSSALPPQGSLSQLVLFPTSERQSSIYTLRMIVKLKVSLMVYCLLVKPWVSSDCFLFMKMSQKTIKFITFVIFGLTSPKSVEILK